MKLKHHLKKHFVPHEGNEYRPHFLRLESAIVILCLIVFIQLFSLAQPYLLSLNKEYFTAAVLPGVLVALTNEQRVQNNVGVLQTNALLTEAANQKANDMATRGYFSHTTPEGYNSWYWLNKVGYLYSYAGENLAINFFESEDVAKAWMNSPTHRDNIVNSRYEEIGIGMASGIYEGKQTVFVAQFFGTPKFGLVNKVAEATRSPISKLTATTTTVAIATTSISTTTVATTSTFVLGAKASSTGAKELASVTFIKSVSATPKSNATHLLLIVAAAILLAILFMLFSGKMSLHKDLVITGLFLIAIISAMLWFNNNSYEHTVTIPDTATSTR